jgi:NAD(P)-dependent dehydrogenase (short-subunit alcohol dehydrogenase family)
MTRFANKVAVITGGSSGMALATAKTLADQGAQVYVTGRRADTLNQAVAAIGERATGIQGDAADLDHLDRLFETVRDRHGHLDVLFASAGDGNLQEPLEAITPASFDDVFGLNVRGTIFAVQKAASLMTEGGSIVLNGSLNAVTGYAGAGIYSASKAALRSLVRTWAAELARRKIRINLVNPGPTNTAAVAGAPKEIIDHLVSTIPLGRLGEPEEIAATVAFLASDESSFITGSAIFVDGGTGQV